MCLGGSLTITGDDGRPKVIRVRRAHLEEDTGKSKHMNQNGVTYSLLDYNRSGMPLLEIVTEADLNSAQEAYDYLTKLRTILRYIGASSGDMEKGAMRCEANVSVRTLLQAAQGEYGVKVEIKNLNSFSAVRGAVEYEVKRHIETIERGGTLQQVTLGWNEAEGRTFVQRSKESAHDYRYFPEPDLPPLRITRELVEQLRATLPELPDAKKARFMADFGLTDYDANVLTAELDAAAFFEAVAQGRDGKMAANWVINELFGRLKKEGHDITESPVSATQLGGVIDLIAAGTISGKMAKDLFEIVWTEGGDPARIAEDRGMKQGTDTGAIEKAVDEIIAANPEQVEKAKANPKLAGWFTGQVIKATGGKALPRTSGRTRIVVMQGITNQAGGNFAVLTQGFPQLVRLTPDVVHADDSRSFGERVPVIGQVRMVNETPLIPDFEQLEGMIAEETRA